MGGDARPPAPERVVVGLSGGPEGAQLLRRVADTLSGAPGAELHAVHVRESAAGNDVGAARELDAQRKLTVELGGVFHTVGGDDAAAALAQFARNNNASQIALGAPHHRSRNPFGRATVAERLGGSADVDLHIVPLPSATPGAKRRAPSRLGRRREAWGFAVAVALPPLLQLTLDLLPHDLLSTDMLVQLAGIVAVALLGGLWPALVAALLAGLVVNYFSVVPYGSLSVLDPESVLALAIFVAVAVAVSLVVDRSARRSKEARLAGAEARILGDLSRRAVVEGNSVAVFLEQIRDHFQAEGAGLWERRPKGGGGDGADWRLRTSAGVPGPSTPKEADVVERLDDNTALTLAGRVLDQREGRLLSAFAAHLLAMLQREELTRSQHENLRLAEGNKMRTAILRAVSHDLRTPLAAIKLASGSLRSRAVVFTEEERGELLATIESGADRLDRLIANLLDMSRITADAVSPLIGPVYWADAVSEALRETDTGSVQVLLPYNLPPVDGDPGMLERVIANLVENALKYAPGSDVDVTATAGGYGDARIGDVPASELRITDHGPGVPPEDILSVFRPFQRADDTTPGTGIGLGLAVAKGFMEAMGGALLAEPTPGGGLTMIIRLPLSTSAGTTTPKEGRADGSGS